jgi:hypothetical protein
MKRTILSALLVGAAVFSLAAPAFADEWHHHDHRYDHRHYHPYPRGYVYAPPRVVYAPPRVVYAPPPVVYAPPPPPPIYAGPSFSITVPLR